MDRNFRRVTLPFQTLIYITGPSYDETYEKISSFYQQNDIPLTQTYSFVMKISVGKVDNTLFILYGVIPNDLKVTEPFQKVSLPHQNFVAFEITKLEFSSYTEGLLNQEFDVYFKQEHIKWDMSKVYALIESHDASYTIYMPYKEK